MMDRRETKTQGWSEEEMNESEWGEIEHKRKGDGEMGLRMKNTE